MSIYIESPRESDRHISISRPGLAASAQTVGIPEATAAALWAELARHAPLASPGSSPGRQGAGGRIDAANVAWYVGGVISLLAMSFFLTTGWSQYGATTGLAISLAYVAIFATATLLFRRNGHATPAGLMATVVVGLVPLVVFATQQAFAIWPETNPMEYADFYSWISSSWCAMEILTIAAALGAWRWLRFPFLLAPATLATWFLAMDGAEALFGSSEFDYGTDYRQIAVSALVGVAALAAGCAFDFTRSPARPAGWQQEAFWMHLGGLLSIWYALTTGIGDETGLAMTVTGLAGCAALGVAVALRRRTYLVFGGIWVFTALAYLAFQVFQGSLFFPLALAGLGIGIVLGGVVLDRSATKGAGVLPEPGALPDRGSLTR